MLKCLFVISIILFSFNLSATEKDKKYHFVASTVIGLGSTYIFEDYRHSLLTCMGVGIAKEVYDHYDYGGFSKKDLLYDAVGCGLGVFTGEMIKIKLDKDSTSINFNYKF